MGQLGLGNTDGATTFTRVELDPGQRVTHVHAAGWNTYIVTEADAEGA